VRRGHARVSRFSYLTGLHATLWQNGSLIDLGNLGGIATPAPGSGLGNIGNFAYDATDGVTLSAHRVSATDRFTPSSGAPKRLSRMLELYRPTSRAWASRSATLEI
jgi:hypothetical protein